MTRLDNYRSAMLAVFAAEGEPHLAELIVAQGNDFVSFVEDHGLGPLWHQKSGCDEFRNSRMAAESLYLAQERALAEIDTALREAGIRYAVFKGAANRLLLYENPALRACHDFDLLVAPEDRVAAALVLKSMGYVATPDVATIGHQLELSQGAIFIDLHWGLLREGRLPRENIEEILARCRREKGIQMLAAEDTFFLLLVHPAFAKHLSGWNMGLHRVADILDWIRSQSVEWDKTGARLRRNGVRTAAWATLRWVQMLIEPRQLPELDKFVERLQPGGLRRAYLNRWLRADLSARMRHVHWLRLFAFSLLLHDSLTGALRAMQGRTAAHRRRQLDLAKFADLIR